MFCLNQCVPDPDERCKSIHVIHCETLTFILDLEWSLWIHVTEEWIQGQALLQLFLLQLSSQERHQILRHFLLPHIIFMHAMSALILIIHINTLNIP